LIGAFGMPFSSTLVEEVKRSAAIQSRHRAGKPNFFSRFNRYSHIIESNAFVMSSLMNRVGSLELWYLLAAFRTDMKLSCMLLLLMKALCAVDMMELMCGARRSANNLAIILVKE
jgi:hypothetical protein